MQTVSGANQWKGNGVTIADNMVLSSKVRTESETCETNSQRMKTVKKAFHKRNWSVCMRSDETTAQNTVYSLYSQANVQDQYRPS